MTSLLVLVALAALTPEQEVEAWDPLTEQRDPAGVVEKAPPNDDATQAWKAAGHLFAGAIVGTGVGLAGGLGAAYAVGDGAIGPWVGSVVFLLCLASGPAIVLLTFDELPLWAPFLAGAAVAIGAGVGAGAGIAVAALVIFAIAGRNGSDCVGCGPEGLLWIAIPPITALVGAATAGLTTTTIAAFAE